MSNPDESQGDAAWRLLNALPAAHASTTSVSTGSGSGGTQSQVVLPSAEPAPVDAYRGFGLAGDSMDVDQDSEEQGLGQEAPGGGTDVFKKPFLPQPSPSQPPGPVQHAVASSSRAANKQPPSPVPMPRNRKRRAPSPDPPSQDSFGVPTGSQEHARHLRDNGGRIAQLVAEDNARLGAGPRRASPESSQTQSSSEPGDRSREIAEPVVLVAGTPSQSQDSLQGQSQSQNPAQDDDDDLLGGGQSSQMYEAFQTLPDLSMVDVEDEENAKSDDSFDARVQDEEDEENPTQIVATQVVEATQETQPLATATTSGGLGTETGMSEQAQKLLRMHNPKRFQALQRSLRSTNASNSTSNPTPSNPSGPTPSVQQTHPTNTNNSAADRAFVHDGDETQQEPEGTQQEPEGTPPPGPLIETQLQSPPRTVPRKRQIPSAKSTQRPATAATSSTAPPPPPPPVQTPMREDRQQHSSPATNNTHSGPSQTYSSSVVPPSVASEVSAPPMSRPPQSQFLSSSLVAPRRPREQDEEIVPDSNPPSSMSMGDTPSSQPVPLAVMLTRKKESEALAKAQVTAKQDKGKGKAKEVPPVGKENENTSLQSDASLGPKRQPPTKHKYGGRRSGDERTDDAQALLALSKSGPGPRSRSASAEAFPGEEDMSLTSPSEGEGEREPDPESQPPLKAGSPRRARHAPRRSPTVEATDPQPTRPPRRVVRGARRAVEPMISMEAVPEAAMDMDLDDAPPTQPTQRRSRAATRVRRSSAAAALRNLKEESDSEEEGGGGEEDGSYRETQESAPVPPPAKVKPATRGTKKPTGVAAKAAPSSAGPPTQTQRGQKRRRVSDNAGQPSQQSQRKRAKLEEAEVKLPTVFAYYIDKYYYPATVTGIEGQTYAVRYADGNPGRVSADQLRPGPAVGEPVQLRIKGKLKTFTILAISATDARVTAGQEDDEQDVSWGLVRRSKAMVGAVPLTAAQITALLREGASEEPARAPVSTRATPAAPDYAARQYSPSERLKDLAFVLTCSAAGDREWRDVLPDDIQDAQGLVLADWAEVVRAGPPPTASGRWCAKAADLVPIGAADKRAFLLTDVAVMTPKFLMALALGMPCVSMHWALDVLEGKVDVDAWHSYLLCAGEADHLGSPVSQMIATDADGNSPNVHDAVAADGWARILRQRRMPFLGKTILLVGSALVPTDSAQFTAQRCIPPVCLAMGAPEVEAVREFSLASPRRFDIVIVEDKARPSSSDVRARMAINGMLGNPTWVKQCLITGQLLAPPSRA